MSDKWAVEFFGPEIGRTVLDSNPDALDRSAFRLNGIIVTSVMSVASMAARPYHLAVGFASLITFGLAFIPIAFVGLLGWMVLLAGLTATSWFWVHSGPLRFVIWPLGFVLTGLAAVTLPFFDVEGGKGETFEAKTNLLLSWPYTALLLGRHSDPPAPAEDDEGLAA